ncbi:hypothetical protein [Caulobacter segnis]|uniref:pentapeptide repeat-containing protein n=1 Tax=Caulobacter segnis TaxID=88688 RepID=UPI002858A2E1|nr:hypothetical protein [Caulobacter segnis]MDR6627610.1 uncharacterized protein YjbI with pentapeptide repeats [Caulobacter segnis]
MSAEDQTVSPEDIYHFGRTAMEPIANWTAADYSWAGLATKDWNGPPGCTTLQDYWRLDPTTGRLRSDAALRKARELVTTPGGVDYCIHHLSDQLLKSFPVRTREAIRRRRVAGLQVRIASANRVEATVFKRQFHISGIDSRAQLQGTWIWPGSFSGAREINANLSESFILKADFERRVRFGPATDFESAFFYETARFAECRFFQVSFDRAYFHSGASFTKAWFLGAALFDEAVFEVGASFVDTRFNLSADLNDAFFPNGADFSRARCQDFVAAGAVFLNASKFEAIRVKGVANFAGAYVAGSSSFTDAEFGPHSTFYGAHVGTPFDGKGMAETKKVRGPVDFSRARFGICSSFERSVFGGVALFVGTVFQPSGSFADARFLDDANFNAAALGRAMKFQRVVFKGDAYFAAMEHSSLASGIAAERNFAPSAAEFHAIDFTRAVFGKLASFPGRRFQEEAIFEEVIWRGPINFAGATFRHDVNIEYTRFANSDRGLWPGPLSLKRLWWSLAWDNRGRLKTGFSSLAAFDAVRARRWARFTAPVEPRGLMAVFRQWGWIEPNPDDEPITDRAVARKIVDEQYAKQETAFRSLRAALAAAAVKVGENRLFELELVARYRRPEAPGVGAAERILAWLYHTCSRFGQSLIRPLLAWAALILLSVPVYWVMGKGSTAEVLAYLPGPGRTTLDPDLGRALQASLAGAFKPFEVWASGYERQFVEPMSADVAWLARVTRTWPIVSRLWSSAVSVLSLTLLFLFGLAIKRRFQVS